MFLYTLGVISPDGISFFFLPGIFFLSFRLAYVFRFIAWHYFVSVLIYTVKISVTTLFVSPQTVLVGVYTVFMLFMHPCLCLSITFCFLKIFKSLLEFHPTLQIYSYLQDKYF